MKISDRILSTNTHIHAKTLLSQLALRAHLHARNYNTWFGLLLLLFVICTTGCEQTAPQVKPQQTVTISKTFQTQVTPVATPTYRCGAWASNNAPNGYSTIIIYAKVTKDVTGVSGANAKATVHFKGFDAPLDQQTSDQNGYVNFTLPLQGHQPNGIPATVDVTFSVGGSTVQCSAFFTPQ
ncbi:MAG TPA: hypothetical protein VFB12_31700 [Ktedonobacteraceae bacterium]|nr:hypothetical protein [Ktedonobacteraceae bacterium]